MTKESFLMEERWHEELQDEFQKPYFKKLQEYLSDEYEKNYKIYPPKNLIFQAFCTTPFDDVKVVIIGQDPYHNPGQAHGLSFSVPEGVKQPPSLQNIFRELMDNVKINPPKSGCLLPWAKQGVLLLNATLTVRENEPKSHHGQGWEEFTDAAIRRLVEKKEGTIFVLWGRSAREKCSHIIQGKGIVLESPHPSPFSANTGFFGCQHFSKINEILKKQNKEEIDWTI